MLVVTLLQQEGDRVLIYQHGELIHTLPLDQDQSLRIEGAHGLYNLVTIQDGEVWVSEASCPDQVCVRHGPTHDTADPIVCLPNELVVQVIRGDEDDPLDKVTQ
jgi:hypothetical protein